MPKLRTRKALAKRVKVSPTGKLIRRHSWKGKYHGKKSSKQLQAYRQSRQVSTADAKEARRGLGA